MRLLIIDGDPRFRELLRHHASCRWPQANCVDYDPGVRGPLAPEVRAQRFDAVLLDHRAGLEWLADLAARPGFAPVVFLSERHGDGAAQRAWSLGASAVLGKDRLDQKLLAAALAAAASRQGRARAQIDGARGAFDPYRFYGARIPAYRRVRRLASGQSSALYLAESEADASVVAIKVGRERLKDSELDPLFKRFRQEHEIVRGIEHPCVVRSHELGVSDERAYLVMEYFRAGDLRRRMRAGVTAAEALRLAAELARALQVVHAAGVLHRDLKPGNVMLREDASLALIDFGLARRTAIEPEPGERSLICGTPHYMSPEQGHGEPTDLRSDLYSLGVILYEMLCRRKPYMAENPMSIIYLHRNAPLPEIPEGLAALRPLIERLLAKRPAERFESAAAAAAALDHAAAQLDSELAA
ncbi:MAG TPA: protein kinase [Steroidobacteraceae bacterium]|nr:protein kinase [Steroidobacteraceae bacterium]